MRILIWSTAPWVKTGYGKNCRYLAKALSKNYEVDILATYGIHGGTISVGDGIRVFPSNNNFWNMGEWLNWWIKKAKIDLVIQHFDLWVVQPGFIENNKIETPIVTYMPVDCIPLPHKTIEASKGSADNVAMTHFTQESFLSGGLKSTTVIPHTVDRSIYFPEDKAKAKKALGLEPSLFIIGCVGTNKGPRKNIPGQLLAFKAFLKNNPDSRFYLHSYLAANSLNPEGYDLYQLIADMGLEEHVIYTDQVEYFAGLEEETMRTLYSAFDVLTECSFGEGFGIPIIEAQACGTPVVGTGFSAIPEVIGAGGISVEIAEMMMWQRLNAFHGVPKTQKITEAYQEIRDNHEKYINLALINAGKYDFSIWESDWNDYVEGKKWLGTK
jgi:glycosyltransferase involved in cell wall biosynthesis